MLVEAISITKGRSVVILSLRLVYRSRMIIVIILFLNWILKLRLRLVRWLILVVKVLLLSKEVKFNVYPPKPGEKLLLLGFF